MSVYDCEIVCKINSIDDFSFILEDLYRKNKISMFLSVSVLADKYERFITENHLVIGLMDNESNSHFIMDSTKGDVSLIIRELRE